MEKGENNRQLCPAARSSGPCIVHLFSPRLILKFNVIMVLCRATSVALSIQLSA